jgi:hypothetical protein
MARPDRIYRRTEAGRKAWETQDPKVLLEYRRLLGLINTDAHADLLCSTLGGRYADEEIAELLCELQRLGLVESVASTPKENLDFTGNFTVSALDSRPSLDFTDNLKIDDLVRAREKPQG